MGRNLKKKNIKFISEIASSHNGSKILLNNLIKKIEAQKNIDFFKIQIFKNKNLCHRSSHLFKILKKIEITFYDWNKIIAKIKNKNRVILEPFDKESYIFCKSFKKINKIKIPSGENENYELIFDALKNYKKVFINFSGLTNLQIKKFCKKFKKYRKKIILMYGFQSYPTNINDLRLSRLKIISNLGFNCGFADHSNSENIGETYMTILNAIENGAKYIEKHVTPSTEMNLPDKISSIDVQELSMITKNLKLYNNFNKSQNISKNELKYCKVMNKFAISKLDIKKNEKFNFNKLIFLRTGKKGISYSKLSQLNKKKDLIYKKSIKKNSIISLSSFYD